MSGWWDDGPERLGRTPKARDRSTRAGSVGGRSRCVETTHGGGASEAFGKVPRTHLVVTCGGGTFARVGWIAKFLFFVFYCRINPPRGTSYFPESFSENPAWINLATYELQSDPSQACPREIRCGELEIYRLSTRWTKHRSAVSLVSKHVAHVPDGPVTSPNGRERAQNSGRRASHWDLALRRSEEQGPVSGGLVWPCELVPGRASAHSTTRHVLALNRSGAARFCV